MKELFLGLILLTVCTPLFAQEKQSYGNKKLPEPLLIGNNVAKRAVVPFQPFVIDATKGQELPEYVTLPEGSKMPREKYLAELNKIEADLNKQGLSIRDNQEVVQISSLKNAMKQSTDLRRSNSFPQASALTTVQAIRNTVMAMPGVTLKSDPDDGGEIANKNKSTAKKTVVTGATQVIITEAKEVRNKIAPFEFTLGDPQTLYAGAFAKYELISRAEPLSNISFTNATPQTVTNEIKKTNSYFSMYIGSEAKASVLGFDLKLYEASFILDAQSNASKKLSKKAIVYRIGKTIFNEDDSYDGDSKEISKVDKEILNWQLADIIIPIVGPIDIRTSFALFGSVGIEYDCSLSRTGLTAVVKPFILAKATLEGSIGLSSVARVGVGGQLDFLNAEIFAGAKSDLGWNSTGWQLNNTSLLNMKLDLLVGRLYGFAEIGVWSFKKRWEHNFYNYNGIRFNKKIIDMNKSIGFKSWRKDLVVQQTMN